MLSNDVRSGGNHKDDKGCQQSSSLPPAQEQELEGEGLAPVFDGQSSLHRQYQEYLSKVPLLAPFREFRDTLVHIKMAHHNGLQDAVRLWQGGEYSATSHLLCELYTGTIRKIYDLVTSEPGDIAIVLGGSFYQRHMHLLSDLDGAILCSPHEGSAAKKAQFKQLLNLLGIFVNENYLLIANQYTRYDSLCEQAQNLGKQITFPRTLWNDANDATTEEVFNSSTGVDHSGEVLLAFYREMLARLFDGNPIDNPDFFRNEQFGGFFYEFIAGDEKLFRSFEDVRQDISQRLFDYKNWSPFAKAETIRYLHEKANDPLANPSAMTHFFNDVYSALYIKSFLDGNTHPVVTDYPEIYLYIVRVQDMLFKAQHNRSATLLSGEMVRSEQVDLKTFKYNLMWENRDSLIGFYADVSVPLLRRLVSSWQG